MHSVIKAYGPNKTYVEICSDAGQRIELAPDLSEAQRSTLEQAYIEAMTHTRMGDIETARKTLDAVFDHVVVEPLS